MTKKQLINGSAAVKRSESLLKMDDDKEKKLALYDETGALLMVDKKERKLIKEILTASLKSKPSRDWIVKKLGEEYLDIGENLLKTLGGL